MELKVYLPNKTGWFSGLRVLAVLLICLDVDARSPTWCLILEFLDTLEVFPVFRGKVIYITCGRKLLFFITCDESKESTIYLHPLIHLK